MDQHVLPREKLFRCGSKLMQVPFLMHIISLHGIFPTKNGGLFEQETIISLHEFYARKLEGLNFCQKWGLTRGLIEG